MDAKWSGKKKPVMFKAGPLNGSVDAGIQSVSTIIDSIDLLTAE